MIRGASFLVVFVAMAIAETIVEAHPRREARRKRWLQNLGLAFFNVLVLRIVFPTGAVAAAVWAGEHQFGLLQSSALPAPIEIGIAIVLLDLTIYAQHVLFHAVPLLFRFHGVHHADVDFDVTLGTRFHPVELLLSMLIKLAAVAVIGASVPAVIAFETILAVTSLFNHANVRLPQSLDRVLRWLIVTPAMHSVHHSRGGENREKNFGFGIAWWDRLFGTSARFAPRNAGVSPAEQGASRSRP